MTWISRNLDLIASYTWSHLALAIPAIMVALILSIVIGGAVARVRRLRGVITFGASLLYAIPSLPLFIVLPLIIGTSVRDRLNIIVALSLYGIALLLPTTVEALIGVDPEVRDAAAAAGYGRTRRFFAVDLPLAGPVILAGLRVVAVSTISLVTVGAVLGVPSLGLFFTDGSQRGINAEIIAGIVMTLLLALIADQVLVLAGKILMPWTRTMRGVSQVARDPAASDVSTHHGSRSAGAVPSTRTEARR